MQTYTDEDGKLNDCFMKMYALKDNNSSTLMARLYSIIFNLSLTNVYILCNYYCRWVKMNQAHFFKRILNSEPWYMFR